MNPLISIIIPCYNAAPFLTQCLESVMSQTYINLEIICVNDGSTDETLDILRGFAEKDFRIRIVSHENKGLSGARNTGLEAATGEFVMFVDSDDWIEPEMTEMLYSCIDQRVLVCSSYNRIWKNRKSPRKLGISFDIEAGEILRRIVGLQGTELRDPSQADSLVTVWGKLYHKNIFDEKQIRFVDTKKIGTEDALFNIGYLLAVKTNAHVFVLDRPLYNYRKYNHSLSNTPKSNLFVQWQSLYEMIAEEIKGKDVIFHDALRNRIALSIIGLGINEVKSSDLGKFRERFKEYLQTPAYHEALHRLPLKYLPIHWKLFFWTAKNNHFVPLYFLLKFMQKKVEA